MNLDKLLSVEAKSNKSDLPVVYPSTQTAQQTAKDLRAKTVEVLKKQQDHWKAVSGGKELPNRTMLWFKPVGDDIYKVNFKYGIKAVPFYTNDEGEKKGRMALGPVPFEAVGVILSDLQKGVEDGEFDDCLVAARDAAKRS